MKQLIIRAITAIISLFAVSAAIYSCNVHEWPNAEPAPLTIKLNFRTDLPLFMVHPYTTKAAEGDSYDVRYIIKAYPILKDSSVVKTPVATFTYTAAVGNDLNYETTEYLPEGRYKLMVWTDYVVKGTRTDLYYHTEDFNNICLLGEHTANTDFRDAFVGSESVTVKRFGLEIPPVEAYIEMERPLAKIIFVTTDLKEFISQQTLELQKQMEKAGETDYTKAPEINIEDYTIVFKYPIYMPATFSVFENEPTDVKTGVTFKSVIKPLSTGEASLGFDYIMVNGKESLAQVGWEIYDKSNRLLSSHDLENVPVIRSKHTIVKGEFLTSKSGGGVSINPNFTDDYNIFIK